ncbi:MAG: hypothetical protein JSW11_09875 [Candidatus Heimdallarchaeota archaeon]|nr:MAG: hypothetical protein JSW11_09875 [Candidatus Heimdallarchaeota archaeon]
MGILDVVKEVFSIAIAGIAFPGLNLSIKPGLYPIGQPDEDSLVLITSNYFVTYKKVVASLERQEMNAWLLVVNTEGVNVWCSAAGGHFTAEKILAQIDESDLSEAINHRELILPQLSAPGVDHSVLKNAEWEVKFGPIEIGDLREYIQNDKTKTQKMSRVEFNTLKRVENTISHNVFISLILIPLILAVAILAQPLGFLLQPWSEWLQANIIFLLIYIWFFGSLFGVLYPKIPFNSGFIKGILLSILLVPLCTFLFFNSSPLDFSLGFGTLLLYGIIIGTDFDGFTPFWGTDFIVKDYTLLAGAAIIIFLGLIFVPFLAGG